MRYAPPVVLGEAVKPRRTILLLGLCPSSQCVRVFVAFCVKPPPSSVSLIYISFVTPRRTSHLMNCSRFLAATLTAEVLPSENSTFTLSRKGQSPDL